MVLKEDKHDELVDDDDEELLAELLERLILVFLSFFLSLGLLLACFSGEESNFASLAGCTLQIPAVEEGAYVSRNLPPSGKNFLFYPLAVCPDL